MYISFFIKHWSDFVFSKATYFCSTPDASSFALNRCFERGLIFFTVRSFAIRLMGPLVIADASGLGVITAQNKQHYLKKPFDILTGLVDKPMNSIEGC